MLDTPAVLVAVAKEVASAACWCAIVCAFLCGVSPHSAPGILGPSLPSHRCYHRGLEGGLNVARGPLEWAPDAPEWVWRVLRVMLFPYGQLAVASGLSRGLLQPAEKQGQGGGAWYLGAGV